jgi:hypothetical protein
MVNNHLAERHAPFLLIKSHRGVRNVKSKFFYDEAVSGLPDGIISNQKSQFG